MKKISKKDITVIVRSTGERTESIIVKALEEQNTKVDLIKNISPNILAIEESFNIGIKKDKPWTLRLDADVIPRKSMLDKLVELINSCNNNKLFEIHTLIFDKFFEEARPAGVYLYRTDLLKRALDFIPQSSTTIRPDTTIVFQMKNHGHDFLQTKFLVGIHDYEQFYKDIYSKCILYAIKHSHKSDYLVDYWTLNAKKDRDFQVALDGFNFGKSLKEMLKIDKSFFRKYSDEYALRTNLQEKLSIDSLPIDYADKIISKHLT